AGSAQGQSFGDSKPGIALAIATDGIFFFSVISVSIQSLLDLVLRAPPIPRLSFCRPQDVRRPLRHHSGRVRRALVAAARPEAMRRAQLSGAAGMLRPPANDRASIPVLGRLDHLCPSISRTNSALDDPLLGIE